MKTQRLKRAFTARNASRIMRLDQMAGTWTMDAEYTLYNRLGSGGFAIEAVLALADVPHELHLLDSEPSSDLSDDFRVLNPWRQVPVLMTPDGRTVTETAAILFYLADEHEALRTGPNLFIDDKAAFYRWTVFMVVNIYEGLLRVVYPDRFAVSKTEPSDEMRKVVRRAALARVHEAFGLIENLLENQQGICGDRLSPADIVCAMLYAWYGPNPEMPNCDELTKSVAQHKVITPIWRNNFGDGLRRDWTARDN